MLREADIGLTRGVCARLSGALRYSRTLRAHPHVRYVFDWDGEDPGHKGFLALLKTLGALTGKPSLARDTRLRAGGKDEELVAVLRALLVARARSGAAPYGYKDWRRP